MRIVYLRTSKPGIEWFLQYYGKVFPEGNVHAVARFGAMERLLEENPHLGQRFGDGARGFYPSYERRLALCAGSRVIKSVPSKLWTTDPTDHGKVKCKALRLPTQPNRIRPCLHSQNHFPASRSASRRVTPMSASWKSLSSDRSLRWLARSSKRISHRRALLVAPRGALLQYVLNTAMFCSK
jgi:hypothetical protein